MDYFHLAKHDELIKNENMQTINPESSILQLINIIQNLENV